LLQRQDNERGFPLKIELGKAVYLLRITLPQTVSQGREGDEFKI
jgi:hypothetical protein